VKDPKKRFRAIQELCKNIKVCRTKESQPRRGATVEQDEALLNGCGAIQPIRYEIEGKLSIEVEFEEDQQELGADKKRHFAAEEVLNVFKGISNDDCKILGFDPSSAKRFTFA
jgi:DNA-directed RNA polymerase II subunit RPB1